MKNSSFRKILSRVPKAVALFVLGILLAVLLIYLNDNGYLAIWHRIQPPPEHADKILHVIAYPNLSGDAILYIQTGEGQIYSIDTSRNSGWEPRNAQENSSGFRCYPDQSQSSYDAGRQAAFLGFRNQIADCRWFPLTFEYVRDNLVFVLLKNGVIYQWRDRAGLNIWLWMICIVPFATMFLGLLLIRVFHRERVKLPEST